MHSEISKIYDPYRLLLNLSDKLNIKTSDKYIALSNLSIYYIQKKYKRTIKKTINFKYQLQHRTKNLN